MSAPLNPMTNTRRYDLDWLRILVIVMLIPFHAAVIFDQGGEFFFKNAQSSVFLAGFTDFLGAWGMQLLFFIAGAACWFMLRKYSWRQFLRERLLRLLLPLVVATVTIIPVMGYFGYLSRSSEHILFRRYYPTFFTFANGDYAGYAGHFSPGHLWFILFLLALTLIALPILIWLNRERGQRLIDVLANLFSKPGVIFLVPIIFLLIDGLPEIAERNVFGFFLLLLLGFVWMSRPQFQEATCRQRYFLLTTALFAGIAYVCLQRWGENQPGFTLGATMFDLLHDVYAWTTIMAMLGFGHIFLNRPGQLVSYLGRASYPIYIIHLPIVITIGYYVIQWSVGVPLKFAVIMVSSFVLTFLAYDLVIKRIPGVRWVFGVK